MSQTDEEMEEDWPVPDQVKEEAVEEAVTGEGPPEHREDGFLLNLLSERSRSGLTPLAEMPRDAVLKAFLSGGASIPRISSLRFSSSQMTRIASLLGLPIADRYENLGLETIRKIEENRPNLLLVQMEECTEETDKDLARLSESPELAPPHIVALVEDESSPFLGSPPSWADSVLPLSLSDPVLRLQFQNLLDLSTARKDLQTIFLAHRVSREQLHKVTFTDPLTGLMNRAGFEDAAARELARICRTRDTLGLLIIDIDHFKRVNDTYGHPIGDSVLRELGRILRNETRYIDHIVRFGGEEFGVILPHTDFEGMLLVAERIRISAEGNHFLGMPGPGTVTVSVGALCISHPRHPTLEIVYPLADNLLYRAKQEGRNRVIADNYE